MRSLIIGGLAAAIVAAGAQAATCPEELQAMNARVAQLTALNNEVKALYNPTPCTTEASAQKFVGVQNRRLTVLRAIKARQSILEACPGVKRGDAAGFYEREIAKTVESIGLCRKMPKK
jgi:hypothetical protein